MELLRPSSPPTHAHSPVSLYGFSFPATSRRGLDRAGTSQLPEIVEEEGNNNKVHVALGKSEEKAMSLLNWTFRRFQGKEICILHVHLPSQLIPTLLGNLPATQASAEVVSTYRKFEKEQMSKLLQRYSNFCSRAKVNASIITIEAEQVQKGIVDLVNENGIRKLVMGAVPENCMKVKKGSSKANYAAKKAPLFCEIWFIHKGKHVWTRDTPEDPSSLPSCSLPQIATAENSRSRSFQYGKNKSIHPDCLQSKSAKSAVCTQISNRVQYEPVHAELASSPTLSRSACTCLHDLNDSSSTTSSSSCSGYNSAERRGLSDSDLKVGEERLYSQLIQATIEAETSSNEACADSLKVKKLELEAREAISKVKAFESALACEGQLRKEAEEALRTTLEEQEKLLEERDDITQELHRTMRNVALLDSRAQEANRRHDEAVGELKLVQESIATLRQEKQRIRRPKIEALRWLERWRSHGQGGATNYDGLVGSVKELHELAEFSLPDLQTATCNFSESFILCQEGYGYVYKGEMMGRTVAIRKLYPYNMQGESEFQQEVKVLGKLQHPHLVTLLGVCPEAWSLVYEYLPNGGLQNHLFRKSNVLTWEIRVRIIAEIASALCFLHSSKPEKIVHGDLTPRKILLDSELRCKICDFGICRSITEDNLQCPSLRWNTGPKGSFYYTDPEFQRIGILTPKSDAYSFGLIVLQLLTRRSPVGLAGEVRKAVSSGKLASILDSSAGEWPMLVARRLADIGLQCCKLNSRDRPDLTPSLVRELEQLHDSEERPVPSFFLCPILQEIMHDPQVAADGFTYEGEAMRGWLQNGKETSPMTNLKLSHLNLTPNHAIRLAIQDWLCKA
ncbi:U-box domain-containing protein 33 [Morus notabilis]|uniref:RING-type E3 ubiquitin transferase n=1 Tax=Morus notabilis TaxID=981085 RepID=W9S274_9ROSA|nr:U-box domain-containing protein 33 [Morus notabilis]XP_024028068.1 U-box domain-containing protein 33 [Morus notabilis]EXC10642.1 U-box domain-containing protein 33 [Morus notabilis]